MPDFLYDLPLLITGPAIIVSLCLFALVGLGVVHRYVLPRLHIQAADSEFTGAMLQAVMVFYGLAVALIAVSVWQSHSEASNFVSEEAAAIAGLYRDASMYPEPLRSEVQTIIADHLNHIIHESWPSQRQGKNPGIKEEIMNRLMRALSTFEPATEGQMVQHAETLHAFNGFSMATRLRVDATRTALPEILWAVILVGALIGLTSSFFFKVEERRLHQVQVLLLSAFIGLVIFMIFALDRPFRGDLGVGPEPYQLVYDHLILRRP